MTDSSSKVTILFIQATPPDQKELDTGEEQRNLDAALRNALNGDVFDWRVLPAARVEDLQSGLRRHRPQIVHFAGHGSRYGELLFDTPDGARSHFLSAENLAETLRVYQAEAGSPVRLAVLAGCHTAGAAELLAEHVDCAVGMSDRVGDEAIAQVFTPALYAALGDGRSVDNAVEAARAELRNRGYDADAEIVQLYASAGVDSSALVLTELVQLLQSFSDVHLEYLRRLFGKPWAVVRLTDMLADRNEEISLLDVYVPLRVDFSIVVKIETQRIVDWWVEQKADEKVRDRELAGAMKAHLPGPELAELPGKLRAWSELQVGEDGLQAIVDGVQRKILRRKEEGRETEDGEHPWSMEAQGAASVQSRFVLLGAPGSGKSSFLRHLALCMAGALRRRAGDREVPANANLGEALNNDWLLDAYTPLYIELRDLVRRSFPDLPASRELPAELPSCDDFWKYVQTHVVAGDLASFGTELPRLFSQGKAILLLDGLDEVPDAADPKRRRQSQIKALVASLVAIYPQIRIIITGRPHAYRPGDWELPGFGRAELRPLDGKRLSELARALFTAIKTDAPDQKADAFGEALNAAVRRKTIKPSMHATPLFFTMLAALWLSDPERGFPDTVAKLYRESVDLLLGRWTQAHLPDPSVAVKLGVPPEQLRAVLETLACTIHGQSQPDQDATEFHVKELLGILLEGGYDVKIQDVPEYLEQRVGLLISPRPHYFQFLHRSFQEHLAACELTCEKPEERKPPVAVDRRFPDGLIERAVARPDLWENVVQLACDELQAEERKEDFWTVLANLCRPYLRGQSASGAAMLALQVADKHDLFKRIVLSETDLITDPRLLMKRQSLSLLQKTTTNILTDTEHFTPEQRDVAGRLLGSGPYPGHDIRAGVGVRADGLPDIKWVPIPDRHVPGTSAVPGTSGREFIYQENERRAEPDFWIAKYPLTRAQFEAFLKADDGFRNPAWWQGLAADEDDRARPGQQRFEYWNHPRERVNWYDAIAFCRWLTVKAKEKPDLLPEALRSRDDWRITLPTEWQWEKAARGHDGRTYPWSNDYESGYANIDETWSGQPVGPHYLQKTSAVGMYPQGQSPYGVMDLSGNVWEWCLNEYENPERFQESGGADRVLRGGSWFLNLDYASALARYRYWRGYRDYSLGLRVVAVPASP